MTIDDVLEIELGEGRCWVCGKAMEKGKAHARVNHGDKMAALCSASCVEAFQKDPKRYVTHREARRLLQRVALKPSGKDRPSSKTR